MEPDTTRPGRRTLLSAAAVAALVASTSGCVQVRSPRRESDPEFYNSYDLLNVDGTIVIDAVTPGHPTRDELGFGENSTFGSIDHDEPFPVLLKLPTGDVTMRSDSTVMTQVDPNADEQDLTSLPGTIIINTSFSSEQEALDAFDAETTAALGLPGDPERDGGLSPYSMNNVVDGYADDDVAVWVEFQGGQDGRVPVSYSISVRRSEQPTSFVPRS